MTATMRVARGRTIISDGGCRWHEGEVFTGPPDEVARLHKNGALIEEGQPQTRPPYDQMHQAGKPTVETPGVVGKVHIQGPEYEQPTSRVVST